MGSDRREHPISPAEKGDPHWSPGKMKGCPEQQNPYGGTG